jgi:hypothetical protein
MVTSIHTILGQKNSETAEEEGDYKGRVVVGGHRIGTSTGVPAHELFQAVSGPPSAMSSTRAVLGTAALKGSHVTVRDAEMAYIQASMNGPGRPQTWIRLPKNMHPNSWCKNGICIYKDPVVLLDKALYGHPESGALWEAHLRRILAKDGWEKIPNHPGLHFNKKWDATLVVYVDDLLLACPEKHTKGIWERIESVVKFKDPPSPLGRYLGIIHTFNQTSSGTTLETQMSGFLKSAVATYKEQTQVKTLPVVATPYMGQDTPMSEAEAKPGKMASTAASHLMKLLFAARMCAPWIITQINRLAAHVSRWSVYHDAALKRLMSFIEHNTHLVLKSNLLRSDLKTCELHLWADADQAGDHSSSKSTSGCWLAILSADGLRSWPVAWGSKKQSASSSSTCEAETISISLALRKEAIPTLDLLEQILGRPVQLVAHEDNSATIVAIQKGYSPALRHLQRTARIALGFTHEVFFDDVEEGCDELEGPRFIIKPKLVHCPTKEMRADLFTKALDRVTFQSALQMTNCVGSLS